MRKIVSLFLVFVLSIPILSVPAFAQTGNDIIMPCYTNATHAQVVLLIDDSGLARITSYCTGISSTSSITATTYLEKNINGSWVRVNIGTNNNNWVDTINSSFFTSVKTHQLVSKGTYRAVTTFVISAGITEVIKVTSEAIY